MLAEWWQQFSNVDSENLIIFCHFYVCCLLFPKYCAFSLFKFKICYFLSFFFLVLELFSLNLERNWDCNLRCSRCSSYSFFFFPFNWSTHPLSRLEPMTVPDQERSLEVFSTLVQPFHTSGLWEQRCTLEPHLHCSAEVPGLWWRRILWSAAEVHGQSAQSMGWVASVVLKCCSLSNQYVQFYFVYWNILEIKSNAC